MSLVDEQPVVYMGLGTPGSGKTTYWKEFIKHHHAAYVCPDDIRVQLYGDYRYRNDSQHPIVWEIAFTQIKQALEQGRDVVVDGAYIGRPHRLEDIALYRQWGARRIVGYWFITPLALAEERNRGREKPIPEGVLPQVYERLQEQLPELSDGFDEIVKIKSA